MTELRTSDAKVCGHDTERLRDLGWYHCPNCGEYIGDHRGISGGGQHCTDNDCRCHGYPLVKRQEHIPSKTNPCGLAFQHWLDEPADAQTTVASAFQAGWDAALRHSSETVSAPAAERVPLRYGKPFTGIHRGISRGGFHCTDNDCSCHLYQYPRAELKASGCPTHGLEHFFEGMCIKCGVVPPSSEGEQHG